MDTLSDFVLGLVDLCMFVFGETSNPVVFVPAFCLFFCGCWALLIRLIHRR